MMRGEWSARPQFRSDMSDASDKSDMSDSHAKPKKSLRVLCVFVVKEKGYFPSQLLLRPLTNPRNRLLGDRFLEAAEAEVGGAVELGALILHEIQAEGVPGTAELFCSITTMLNGGSVTGIAADTVITSVHRMVPAV